MRRLNSLFAPSATALSRNPGLASWTEFEEAEALEMILKNKPKVDAVDAKKMTALHVAAGKGNLEIVRLLVGIALGSLNSGRSRLLTPQYEQIERGHANVNAVDAKGNTALYACLFVRVVYRTAD